MSTQSTAADRSEGNVSVGSLETPPLHVSAPALQRYEEPVFCVAADGLLVPANPLGRDFLLRLKDAGLATLPGTAASTDVGVDCFGFRPVTLDEIRIRLAENAANAVLIKLNQIGSLTEALARSNVVISRSLSVAP